MFKSGSSKSRLDVQDKPKSKKWFSNQVPVDFSKIRNDRGSKPKPQKGRNVDPPTERPTCGKKHVGECLIGTNNCYGYGKGGHMVKDCPNVRSHGKGNGQTQPSGPSSEAPKRNHFYALKARGEQESAPAVMTGML